MKVKFRDIEVEYRGREAIEVPFPKGKKIWRYRVRITRGNKSRYFLFHDSIRHYEEGIATHVLCALECILYDAYCVISFDNVEEMAKELAISSLPEAKKIWKINKKILRKLRELGLSEEDVQSYYEEFCENTVMKLEAAKEEMANEIRNLEAKS